MLNSKRCKKYECSICHEKYSKLEEIRAHVKANHLVHVTCVLCDKVFTNKLELSNHKKLHFQVTSDLLGTNVENETPAPGLSGSKEVNRATPPPRVSREYGGGGLPIVAASDVDVLPTSGPHQSCFSDCIENDVKDAGNQDALSDRVSESAPVLSKGRNSPATVFSDSLPEQGQGSSKISASIDEGGDGSTSNLSSSTPSKHRWKSVPISASPKKSGITKNELQFPDKAVEPLNFGCEDYVLIPYKEVNYIQMPDHVEVPTELVDASMRRNLDIVGSKCKRPPNKYYQCIFCEEKYDSIKSVQSHIKENHVNLLSCLQGKETSATRSQLLNNSHSQPPPERRVLHDGEDSVQGELGNSSASKAEAGSVSIPGAVLSMSKSPRAEKEYKCKLCPKKFACVEDVRIHVKSVHLIGLTCALCNAKFSDKHSLVDHAKVHSDGVAESTLPPLDDREDNRPETLPDIETVVENASSLTRSRPNLDDSSIEVASEREPCSSSVHDRGDVCHKCDECQLFFDGEKALALHQEMHKKVLYKCGVCEFVSSSKKSVVAHLSQEHHSLQGDFN